MKRIVTCGIPIRYDFGCPSILQGMYELLKEIYHDDFEMIHFARLPVNPLAAKDMPFKIVPIERYTQKDSFEALFLGKKSCSESEGVSLSEAFDIIRGADAVIDLYGIRFCDKLRVEKRNGSWLPIYSTLYYPFISAAKKYHVRTIKNTASYGPAETKENRRAAKYALNLFDCMVARERKSLEVMQKLGADDRVLLSPDTANLMPFSREEFNCPTVGISTSHQMVRQWKNTEGYLQCMVRLCLHIRETYGANVLLIPNECDSNTKYNDIDVATDILKLLQEQGGDAEILPAQNMTSVGIKSKIAACDAVVAARYHSCVAALSAGVPLMVLGWHYKYEELMHWYGQDKWMLSETNCTAEKLVTMFDEFWKQRKTCAAEIKEKYPTVRDAVIQTGQKMLGITRGQ